jgi:putative spermidine/putrescine transport system permease protein
LPLIRSGIIAGCLFAFIISWINVEISIFNTTSNLMPIPVKLFNYIQYNVDPMIAAVSAATIYIAIIVVLLLDRVVGIENAATNR